MLALRLTSEHPLALAAPYAFLEQSARPGRAIDAPQAVNPIHHAAIVLGAALADRLDSSVARRSSTELLAGRNTDGSYGWTWNDVPGSLYPSLVAALALQLVDSDEAHAALAGIQTWASKRTFTEHAIDRAYRSLLLALLGEESVFDESEPSDGNWPDATETREWTGWRYTWRHSANAWCLIAASSNNRPLPRTIARLLSVQSPSGSWSSGPDDSRPCVWATARNIIALRSQEAALGGASIVHQVHSWTANHKLKPLAAPRRQIAIVSDSAVAEALRYLMAALSTKTRWGGSGPDYYDCSGLVAACFDRIGVWVPRSAARQAALLPHVSSAAPLDLLFYGQPIDHVAIRVGDGRQVEASSRLGQVVVGPERTPVLTCRAVTVR
jgi:cell wall-associated NlpC family hydrolase